ncbi:hypothetical protein [Pseudopedobacter sp.]|uniref:hypothetical protein n=1 Tax=Pseudopedobacter sp. TaxID=1936787 RepID=UPI00333FB717
MKRNQLFLAVIALFAVVLLNACSKNEGKGLRKLTYKVSGDVTVPVTVQYTPTITDPNETDFSDYNYEETITSLPWEKTVSLHQYASGGGLSVSVEDAVPGTSLTLKIFEGSEEKATKTVVVNGNGWIDNGLLNYYFPEFNM